MDIDEFLAGDFLNQSAGGATDLSDEDDADGSDEDEGDDLSDLEGSDGDEDNENGMEGSPEYDEEEEESSESESDSEGDDDDEEETGGGAKAVKKNNKKLKSEIGSHKEQLEKLKQQDPEFYAYLQATDKELLAFGDDNDEENSESDSEGDHPVAANDDLADADLTAGKAGLDGKTHTVTLAMVDSWCKAAMKSASWGSVRSLVKAYRVACHFGDSEEQVDEGMRIASSSVYNKLMLFMLVRFPVFLNYL